MATPISDTLALLKEFNKGKADRRKTASDQLMKMTKMNNDRDIKLMSTKITIADRERTASLSKFNENEKLIKTLNDGISLTMGATEMINNPLDKTSGSIDAVNDIKGLVSYMSKDRDTIGRNVASQESTISTLKEKLGHYNSLSAFFKGKGVSDFDESGTIDESDATMGNYFKSMNIDESKLDPGTMRALNSLNETGYRDVNEYLKLDTAYKKELQESDTYSKSGGNSKTLDFLTNVRYGPHGIYIDSATQYALDRNDPTMSTEEKENSAARYHRDRFSLSANVRPSILEKSVKKTLELEGSELTGSADEFLDKTYTELGEKFRWDTFKYNEDLEEKRKNLSSKKKLESEELIELQSIELKQSILETANSLNLKYRKILDAANDPDNPNHTEYINEIEEIYSEYEEASQEDKVEIGQQLRDFLGFNPESASDVKWLKNENIKSANDSLKALGLDEIDDDDKEASVGISTKENFANSNILQNNEEEESNEEEGVQFYDNPVPHLSNMVAGYEGSAPVLTQDMSMDAAYGGSIAEQEIVEAEGLETGQSLSPFTPEEYIANNPDVSPSIRAMLENTYPKEKVVESLDKIEDVATAEETDWNNYLKTSDGIVSLDPLMSGDSEFNMHSDSLDTMPLATITLDDTEFKARVNWVNGHTWSPDGQAMGSLDGGLKAMPRYNDSGNILSETVTDKDFIRSTIKTPGYELEEKLNNGEFLGDDGKPSPQKFLDYLRTKHSGNNIPILDLFYDKDNFDKNDKFMLTDNHQTVYGYIYEVMKEYESLKTPATIRQHGINRTLEQFSDADTAMAAVADGTITQDTYDRAFPSD